MSEQKEEHEAQASMPEAQEATAPSSTAKGKRKATEQEVDQQDSHSDQHHLDVEDDDEEEEEEEEEEGDTEEPNWHTEAQDKPHQTREERGAKAAAESEPKRPTAGDWQAIYSAQHNAYYFHNTKSGETTWTNPITEPQRPQQQRREQHPESYGGIDPELAYLDPSLQSGSGGQAGAGVTARFNARTGKFQGGSEANRNPEYHSDFSRAKRQSSFFFDVDAWEKQRELQQEASANAEPKKHKHPSKKELEMFKAKKQERKKAKLMARYGD